MAAHRGHARAASLPRLTALALREPRGSAHYTGGFMATLPTKAITKQELNSRNDKTAAARYSKRRVIDQRIADRALRHQLREVWDDPLHLA